MLVTNAVALFACALAGIGLTFGLWYVYIRVISLVRRLPSCLSDDHNWALRNWLFTCRLNNLTLFCYHCFYLPFLYITFSADIFQVIALCPLLFLLYVVVPHFDFLQLGMSHDLGDCDVLVLQEEDLLLENAYYSEMKDAGFFDVDWDWRNHLPVKWLPTCM